MSELEPVPSTDAVPEIRLTEAEKELVRTAQFGNEMQAFVHGIVGQYLFDKAAELEAASDESLRFVNPSDVARIVEYQVQARAAAFFKSWILEAVSAGEEARAEIEAEVHRD